MLDRQTLITHARPVQVQPMDTEPFANLGSLPRGFQQHVRALGIRQTAFEIAVHYGESCARIFMHI